MARYGYCFTLNNYTPANEVTLQGAIGQCGISYLSYGREVGEQGTPHLQGYLQSNQKNKSRFHQKLGIYVMPQERSAIQARNYTQKDGDFWESGEFNDSIKGSMEKKPGARNDLEEVKKAINSGISYDEICETHFQQAAMYGRFIKERIQARDSNTQLDSLRKGFESSALRPWQQDLLDVVTDNPHPRQILWIWEKDGNTGKSWLANYLGTLYSACVLNAGRKTDMAYIYSQKPAPIVIFDLPRTTEASEDRKHILDGTYSLAEDLKNGRITSTKYESKTIFFSTPHVIFFANFEPDYTKWSSDRYAVKNLNVLSFD